MDLVIDNKGSVIELHFLTIEEAAQVSDEYCRSHFPERLERSGRFRHEEDRLRCIGAGILMQRVLGADEADIVFNAHGKPYLREDSRRFSISHSGKFIVLAVSDRVCDLGVDIEIHNEKHLRTAKSVLCKEEAEWMADDSLRRFYQLWTMKESLMKADGRGLAMPHDFNVLPLLEDRELEIDGHVFHGISRDIEGYGLSVVWIEA